MRLKKETASYRLRLAACKLLHMARSRIDVERAW
jgi:hypothetical protein